jgi:uncharacterized protein
MAEKSTKYLTVGLTAMVVLLFGMMPSDSVADQRTEKPGNQGLLDLLGVKDVAEATDAVAIPMRDGVSLSALILRPKALPAGVKSAIILIKTPYVPAVELGRPMASAVLSRLIRAGYAVAVVNDRGTQWSDGEFHLQHFAGRDGYDTVSWLAEQSWSSGKVGSFGCSSSAENQWVLATMNHPAHKAMVVMSATAGIGSIPGYREQAIFYAGGVPSLDWAWWYLKYGHIHHPHLPAGLAPEERARLAAVYSSQLGEPLSEDLTVLANHLPSADILKAVSAPSTEFDHLITLSPTDSDWNYYDFLREGESTRVPGLHIDSWYATLMAYGTTKAFEYLSRNSPNQYLVMGATAHCEMGAESRHTMVGDRDVGDATFDYVSLIVDWFDHWLDGKDNGTTSLPNVQYYPLASSQWRSAASWPPPGTKSLKLFLDSTASANSVFGDGRLDEQPRAGKSYDRYLYDPRNPVPSKGGGCCDSRVAQDQSALEARNDVLVYTTDPLTKSVEVAGYISAKLFVASSAPDTDLMLKLVDVYPDGRAFNVLDTALRLRYRNGYESPKLMTPGHIYEAPMNEMVLASRIPAGHRIRIEVTSSNFPNYERNLNTGGQNFNESHPMIAVNKIYHDRNHRSFIALPILDAREQPEAYSR